MMTLQSPATRVQADYTILMFGPTTYYTGLHTCPSKSNMTKNPVVSYKHGFPIQTYNPKTVWQQYHTFPRPYSVIFSITGYVRNLWYVLNNLPYLMHILYTTTGCWSNNTLFTLRERGWHTAGSVPWCVLWVTSSQCFIRPIQIL